MRCGFISKMYVKQERPGHDKIWLPSTLVAIQVYIMSMLKRASHSFLCISTWLQQYYTISCALNECTIAIAKNVWTNKITLSKGGGSEILFGVSWALPLDVHITYDPTPYIRADSNYACVSVSCQMKILQAPCIHEYTQDQPKLLVDVLFTYMHIYTH